jgi:hypothetical protein
MATKVEIVKQLIAAQDAGNWDAVSALLTDDAVMASMRGTQSGKQAMVQAMQQAASQARQFSITWSEPAESGDVVSRSASTQMGRLTQRYSFSGEKISKIEMAMG